MLVLKAEAEGEDLRARMNVRAEAILNSLFCLIIDWPCISIKEEVDERTVWK